VSEKRFALIIANDKYNDESLRELEAPQSDANALAKVLGDPETCNFLVQILVNRRAHRVNQVIEAFFDDRGRDDLLLLYFSGHGVKDEDGKLYFATPDTKRNRLMSTAVSASFINDLMRRTRSRRQVLLLDCCFSGAFAKGMIAKSGSAVGSSIGTSDYFQGRGRVVLTASDAMQYAFEEDELVEEGAVKSIFTSAIVDGIESWKADRDRDDRISITELYDYVDSYVHERTPNQRPSMWSFETQGEIIIAEREYIPEVEEEEIPEYVPKVAPKVVSKEEPEIVPEVVPEAVLEVTPEVVPEVVPREASEAVPEVVLEVVPEAAPEIVPEIVPEEIPEGVPEAAPEVVPEEDPEEKPPKVTAEEPEVISEGTPPEKKPSVSESSAQPQRSFPLVPAFAVLVIIGGVISVAYIQGWIGSNGQGISIDDFSATPSVITRGGSSTLSWSVSGATRVIITPEIGDVTLSGERLVFPSETTTYTLTVTKEDESVTAQVVVTCTLPHVIQIGITASSTQGLGALVPFVDELLEPDVAAYVSQRGYDITFDFVVADNQGSAATTLENTQTFRAMDIDLIIGHDWSSHCSVSLSYVNENDMLLFSAGSASPILSIQDDMLFRACPPDFVQAPIIADMWSTWGAEAVLIFFRADAWGDSLYTALAPELADRGIVELGRIRYAGESTEFSNYLEYASDIIADGIALYGKERIGIQFISFSELKTIQTQAADYPQLIDIVWMTVDSAEHDQYMLDMAGEWATKTRHFSATMATSSIEFIEFDERYYEVTGHRASFNTAALYDASRFLVETILAIKTIEPSEIVDVLIPMSQDYHGLTGWMSLDENGDRQPQMYDIWGFYEHPISGEYLFMNFGAYDGQKGEVDWDDEALENFAGITRPGA